MEKLWELFKEGDCFSLTRILVTLGYVAFLGISLYLAFAGKVWGNYGEFAFATGGAVLVQLGNKYINSKYNTPQGEVGKRVSTDVYK